MFVVTAVAFLEAAGYIARLLMLNNPGFGTCEAFHSQRKRCADTIMMCACQQELYLLPELQAFLWSYADVAMQLFLIITPTLLALVVSASLPHPAI